MGGRQLVALAVLPAGQLHSRPDPVFLADIDSPLGASALLRQRAPTQADRAGFDLRRFVRAGLGRPVGVVVIGVPEPQFRIGCTRLIHRPSPLSLMKALTKSYINLSGLA